MTYDIEREIEAFKVFLAENFKDFGTSCPEEILRIYKQDLTRAYEAGVEHGVECADDILADRHNVKPSPADTETQSVDAITRAAEGV